MASQVLRNIDYYFNNSDGRRYVDADAISDFIHWTLVFLAIPAVSILGCIGNSLSIVVLYKHGFKKSSNILLFTLAVSDITFMIGVNGPPKVMYEWGRGGFLFPEHSARILYYFYHFFDILNWGSGPASLCIPALITIERFVAVFFPLKFGQIVTRRRTLIALSIPYIIFYGLQAYIRAWFQFVYVFDPSRNATMGMAARSELYWQQKAVSEIIEIFFNGLIILVLFVGAGSLAIGVKIKLAAIKRFKMTNNSGAPGQKSNGDVGMSRTTKTLLCLCVFYTLACGFVTLPAVIPNVTVFPLFMDQPNFRSVSVFTYHVFKLALSINASCNFIIYVAMNKKFRDTFLELVVFLRTAMKVRTQLVR